MDGELELERLGRDRTGALEAANAALRQSERRLQAELDTTERLQRVATQLIPAQGTKALFDQILDAAVAILHSDFASIQMFCPEYGNSGALRLLGHRGFTACAADRWEWVDTDMHTTCAEALRTGRRVATSDVRSCAFMSGTSDLDEYLAAGIHAVQSTPLISRSGVLLGIVSTHWQKPHEMSLSEQRAIDILARLAADVLERARTEDNLQEALDQLEFITANMACGVARCSKDLRYLWVNPSYAAWMGLTPGEVAGRPIVDVIGQDAYNEIRPHIERALSGDREEFEANINYRGSDKRVHKLYMPTRGSRQEIDGWLSMITDVTQATRAQAESFAKQKLESIGMLASGIAHDFNNLMGGVLAQAELARMQLVAGLNPSEELNAIRDVAMRGSEIVRELMIYAGKESGIRSLVDISRIVQEMVPFFKVSVSKHASLVTRLGEDLPGVWANDSQLRQILLNLVINASDAIGDRDGTICVATGLTTLDRAAAMAKGTSKGDFLRLEVADTGRGMSRETQAKVFEPFFTTKPSGRGIGLAVVHGIVRSLGGTIFVASKPDEGTTFQILLPVADTAMGPARDQISVAEQMADTPRTGTVLVADDEDSLRCAVGKMLRFKGFDVLEAADGVAAVNLLRAGRGDIRAILLDMNMPGPPTDEVIAAAAEVRPEIKVIVTSAFSEEVVKSRLGATQFDGFIRKPFRFDELARILRD